MNNISLNNNIKAPQPNDTTFSAENVNMGAMPQSMQGINYNTLPTSIQNKIEDNALTQGYNSFNIFEHPVVMFRNGVLSILGATGLVHAINWSMQSKKIASTESHIQNFSNTRLTQVANNINDDLIKSKPGQWLNKIFGTISTKLHSIAYPTVLKEAFEAMKTGSISQWDKLGMFSLGKSAEAKNDFMEFLQKVDKNDFDKLAKALKIDAKELQTTIENFTKGKISSSAAYDKIAKISNIDAASAKILSEIKIKGRNGTVDKILGTKADINLALTKIKMFNKGIQNQGIIAKAIQKSVALFGDAIGGGILSGKGGLLMGGLITLITPLNRSSSAPKGDKIAAFMEEFWDFAIGSYIMALLIGVWFNKFLGVTEMGMDKKAIAALAKKMGIELDKGLLSECAINYAREFGKMKKANKLLERFRNGNHSEKEFLALQNFAINKLHISADKIKTPEGLLQEMTCLTNTRNEKYFNSVKAEIKNIYKNGITLDSVMKNGAKNNSGNFATRLSRYIIAKTGKLFSFGRYVLPQAGKNNAIRRTLRGAGGLGRIILVSFILLEPFRIGFMKLSNLIFGTPKDSELITRKKEKAEKKANKAKKKAEEKRQALEQRQIQEKQQQALLEQRQKMLNEYYQKQQEVQQTTLNNPNIPNSQTTIKTETARIPAEIPLALTNHQNQEIAAKKLGLINQDVVQTRRYIPSAMPAQIKEDNQPDPTINSTIVKADKTERYVNKFLSKNL